MDAAEPEPAPVSLFPADQAVLSDEAVTRVFSTRLELPSNLKVALMKFPDRGWGVRDYGRYYWSDEHYLKLQQTQIDSLSKALTGTGCVTDAQPLPSLLTPNQLTLPRLRESAVRMQADLLLIYRINSDLYSEYRTFAKDRVKAYSTCELVLMDTRTGLVPFTRVISSEDLETKLPADLDFSETSKRAEEKSADAALQTAAAAMAEYIKSAPKKNQ
jgi:hypothetical protein